MPAVGESYAGIYVPMLAREVVKGNRRGVKPHINIQVCAGIQGSFFRRQAVLKLLCGCVCPPPLRCLF